MMINFAKRPFLVSFLIMISCFVSSCNRTKSSDEKPSEIVTTGSATYYSVSAVDYYVSGMHYKVFNSANGGVFVVNITKDSLEVVKQTKQ